MDASTTVDKVDTSDSHNRNMKKQSISNGAGGGADDGANGGGGGDNSGAADYTKFMTECSTKLSLASTLMLDDLQGDSSLEPGEVKTPPHHATANTTSAITTTSGGNAHAHDDEPHPLKHIQRGVEMLRKKPATKSLSSSTKVETTTTTDIVASVKHKIGTEVGEMLDTGIGHKTEPVKPKKCAADGEQDTRTANSATSAVDVAAQSQTANEKEEESESEGLYSSSNESSPERQEKECTAPMSIAKSPPRHYSGDALPMGGGGGAVGGPNGPAHLMPPYQDAYMGYRHQFARGSRPDFHHGAGRGGFMPRMRGNPRFPGYRPPFFSNGPPRHHMSNPRHHTPPPSRGHSPIKAPALHLFWTKTKPSISYAFNDKLKEKSTANKSTTEHTAAKHEKTSKSTGDEKSRSAHAKQQHAKSSKSAHERDKKRKRRASRSSSEKSYKRNIEKIRESMKRRTEKVKPQTATTATTISDEDKLARKKCSVQENAKCAITTTTPPPPVEQNIWCMAKKIKVEKIDADEQREGTPCLELLKEKIKVEIEAVAEAELDAAKRAVAQQQQQLADGLESDKDASDRAFDMFAESPPHGKRRSAAAAATKEHEKDKQALKQTIEIQTLQQQQQQSTRSNENEKCEAASKTPLPTAEKKIVEDATAAAAAHTKLSRRTALQQAIATQKRIGELLQDDDLDMEAIEATKKKLLQSTSKSQAKALVLVSKTPTTEAAEKPRKDESGAVTGGAATVGAAAVAGGSVAPIAHDVHKHRNPFKRSVSRERYHTAHSDAKHRSRTNSRDREERGRRKYSVERNRMASTHNRGKASTGSCSSLNRSSSGERGAFRSSNSSAETRKSPTRHQTSRTPPPRRRVSNERGKTQRSNTPPPPLAKPAKTHAAAANVEAKRSRDERGDRKSTSTTTTTTTTAALNKRKELCLSFTPAEFLYPNGGGGGDEDDTADVDWDVAAARRADEDDDTNSSRRKSSAKGQKNASPDTDDYMDNWENDDVNDLDLGASVACDSSTPRAPAKANAVAAVAAAADVGGGALNDTHVTRYVNPSPPVDLQLKQATEQATEPHAAATPNARSAKGAARVKAAPVSVSVSVGGNKHAATPTTTPTAKAAASAAKAANNNELFGMQEIYDQFIKSVEDAGVTVQGQQGKADADADELTPPAKPPHAVVAKKPQRKLQPQRKRDERASTTSSSSSSSASASSSSSSSSSGADTSSSSSSSSSASSESEEEEDEVEQEKRSERARKSRHAKQQRAAVEHATATAAAAAADNVASVISPATNVCATPPMHHAAGGVSATATIHSPMTPPMRTKARTASPATPVLPSTPTNATLATAVTATATSNASTPVKVKSDAAKDFKKLKSLEANLARIQLMRENYDSADEISEELLKMEKLFMQEKNLILHKYATKATATSAASSSADAFAATTEVAEVSTPPPRQSTEATLAVASTTTPTTGQFVPSLQQTVDATAAGSAADDATAAAAASNVANRIFDSNREAIKLTISPLKLSRTPTIFEKLDGMDKSTASATAAKRSIAELDELDFTEKLVKPTKEIAIVKPMMESKESKEYRSSQQRSRRSSPGHDAERLPTPSGGGGGGGGGGGHRDRSRRSASRSRYSPQRRGRARSLSVSPLRGSGGGGNTRRANSPHRRQGGGGGSGYTSRLRNTTRRSRSRSHSRQPGSGRRGDFSPPPHHRRRRGVLPRKGALLRGYQRGNERDSRSRSPRPHSPRSPPPPTSLRRSYSRDRYSRSPLPFKPPSPPLRHSLSPVESQRNAAGASSRRRSRSPRMPRSPRSPLPGRYHDDHRRGYDRRSLSPLQSSSAYYAAEGMSGGPAPASASAYSYYNHHLSPNRISLDARINIVLNGPHGGQETHASTPYDAYSNYSQYGSAATYMSLPPHPHPAHHHAHAHSHPPPSSADVTGAYYANQYVAATVAPPPMQPHAATHAHPPPMYSSIPTISGAGGAGGNGAAQNYYYNELNALHAPPPHHALPPPSTMAAAATSPLVKELPKANSVAVQKGNVLEIVPTVSAVELGTTTVAASVDATAKVAERKPKVRRPKPASWRDEVKNRQIAAAALKLSREGDGDGERSILKPLDANEANVKEEKSTKKKKVYFEDGIFPKCDSEDEDRKLVEDKVRRKLRQLKRRGLHPPCSELLHGGAEKSNERAPRIDPELEKLPPPAPPFGLPAPQCPQPLYLRPPTPTPMLYFHYDSVVHSMYVSQLEKPIPPRLLNQKPLTAASANATGASASGNVGAVLSPLSAAAAVASASAGSKKDLGQLPMHRAAPTTRAGDYSATPKLIPTLQRHEHINAASSAVVHMLQQTQHHQQHHHSHPHPHPHPHHQPPPPHYTIEPPTCSPALTKGTFHAITTTAPPLSPQLAATAAAAAAAAASASQRQSSPIGFIGMRINNLVRLPPSSLMRSVPPTVVNVRHPSVYQHIPPPSASGEFTIAPPPTLTATPSYNAYTAPPPQFYNGGGGGVGGPPATYSNGVPLRQQPPGYFVHQQPPQVPAVAAVIRSPLIELQTPAAGVVTPTASISTMTNTPSSSTTTTTPISATTNANAMNESMEKAEPALDNPQANVTAVDAQKL